MKNPYVSDEVRQCAELSPKSTAAALVRFSDALWELKHPVVQAAESCVIALAKFLERFR